MSVRRSVVVLSLSLLAGCAQLAAGPAASPAASGDWGAQLIDPVTAPFEFESPKIETDVQPVVIANRLPQTSLLGDGDYRVFAVQARAALTDRFAVVLNKFGHVSLHGGPGADEHGSTDLGVGAKYAILNETDTGVIVTAGLDYEADNGARSVAQGNGEGLWRPYVSGAFDMDGFSLVTSVGANFPVAGRREPQWIDWHLHLSPTDFGDLVPLFEVNGYHYTNNARAVRSNVEGLDLATLGASNVAGNDIITGAVGFRYRVTDSADFGVAYERPLTERRDILRDRLTLDWIQRF